MNYPGQMFLTENEMHLIRSEWMQAIMEKNIFIFQIGSTSRKTNSEKTEIGNDF